MKTRIILIGGLIFICVMLKGQDVFFSPDTAFERQSATFEFTSIILVDSSFTKDLLYQKVRQWFAETYNSSKNVIDNADKDEGVIYGKGIFEMTEKIMGYVEYNISVRCKKGKVKYLFTNFNQRDALQVNTFGYSTPQSKTYNMGPLSQTECPVPWATSGMGNGRRDKVWMNIKFKTKENTYNLIQDLKAYLKKSTTNESDSW